MHEGVHGRDQPEQLVGSLVGIRDNVSLKKLGLDTTTEWRSSARLVRYMCPAWYCNIQGEWE